MVAICGFLIAILLTAALTYSAAASAAPSLDQPRTRQGGTIYGECEDGPQDSGAQYRICMPKHPFFNWNGDLVVYAHGYVAVNRPVEIPEHQMILPGTDRTVDQVANSMGYAFATTSYYTNGLAVLPAMSDLVDLVDLFTEKQGAPDKVYLLGVSEGGLITTLSVEQNPDVFDGGLAMCGPYGDFHGQINHFGDVRVVFDYFFPELIPGSPISIPNTLIDTWETGHYSTTVKPALEATDNVTKVSQLLTVTGLSPYAFDPPTSTNAIGNVLWYNVFATNDARAKLGGQPFENETRVYSGSDDDAQLNANVDRFSADPAALQEIEDNYQTTGNLTVPLVTLHTTGDPVVPYWHATEYLSSTIKADTSHLHRHFKVDRHGHCNFTRDELLAAFGRLVTMVRYPQQVFLPLTVRER